MLRDIPTLLASGVEALRSAAIVDIKDLTALYAKRFIDEALRA
jgi:hypothetical protein